MKRSHRLPLAFATFLFASLTVPAYAQPDPQALADRAIANIRAAAQDGREAIARVGGASVQRIDRLQEAGQQQQAERAAHLAVDHVNAVARRTVREIHSIASRAATVLERMGAEPELIRSVRQAAAAASESVNDARQRALHAIREAVQP